MKGTRGAVGSPVDVTGADGWQQQTPFLCAAATRVFGCVTLQGPPTTGRIVCLALTHAQASRLACDAFQTTRGSNVRSGVCGKSLCPLSRPLFLLRNRHENTARPARYRVEQSWGGPIVLAEAMLNQRTAGRPQPAADSRCLSEPS